jgi:hypothetical protein
MPPKLAAKTNPAPPPALDLLDIPPQDQWLTKPPHTSFQLDYLDNVLGMIDINIKTLFTAIGTAQKANRNPFELTKSLQEQFNLQTEALTTRQNINKGIITGRNTPNNLTTGGSVTVTDDLTIPPTFASNESDQERAYKQQLHKQLKQAKSGINIHEPPFKTTIHEQNKQARRKRQTILDKVIPGLKDGDLRRALQKEMHGPDEDHIERYSDESSSQSSENPENTIKVSRKRKEQSATLDPFESLPSHPLKRHKSHPNLFDSESHSAKPSSAPTNSIETLANALLSAINHTTPLQTDSELPPIPHASHADINFLPAGTNGTPLYPQPLNPNTLWPHIEKSTLLHVKNGDLPIEKLYQLIPTDERPHITEKSELTLDHNGALTQSKSIPNLSKLGKHFPTMNSFLAAFATWMEIRIMYNAGIALTHAGYLIHIRKLLLLSTSHTWSQLIRYELAFFRSHQSSLSREIWANIDHDLILTSNLNVNEQRPAYSSSKQTSICFRFNRVPAPGQETCNQYNCKYIHRCNFDPQRCTANHPAYRCPLSSLRSTPQSQPQYQYTPRDRPSGTGPNTSPLASRISRQ